MLPPATLWGSSCCREGLRVLPPLGGFGGAVVVGKARVLPPMIFAPLGGSCCEECRIQILSIGVENFWN